MSPVEAFEERVRTALPHVSSDRARAFAGVLARLVEVFRPDRVYVFGSQACGTAQPDSDVDVLVVVPSATEPEYRLAARAYAEVGAFGLPLELVFLTRAEFDARARAAASLPAAVLREGRLLYAA
jgi:uncharacterized protein